MSILDKGYKEPSTANYMKFVEGVNIFRMLSDSIEGWEIWEEIQNEDGSTKRQPLRFRKDDEIPQEKVGFDKFGNSDLKFFWAFVVYNFTDERIQILELTQATIRQGILALIRNKKWGDPRDYNLAVTRIDGEPVKYIVQAEPKEELPKEILDKYKAMNIKLEKLYDGKDPFEKAKSKDEEVDLSDVPDKIPG